MSHSQFHCTGRAYLDMHGLIFETSICYWQDQPGRKRERSREGTGEERERRGSAGVGGRAHARDRTEPSGRNGNASGQTTPTVVRHPSAHAKHRGARASETNDAPTLSTPLFPTPSPRGIGRAGTVAHTGRGAGWVARAGGKRSDRRRSPARKATSPRATTGAMKRGPGGRATAGAEPGRPPVETRRHPRQAAARQTRSRRDTRQGLLGRAARNRTGGCGGGSRAGGAAAGPPKHTAARRNVGETGTPRPARAGPENP